MISQARDLTPVIVHEFHQWIGDSQRSADGINELIDGTEAPGDKFCQGDVPRCVRKAAARGDIEERSQA